MSDLDHEIEKNLSAFKKELSILEKSHSGRYALLRHEKVVGIYDTIRDAQLTGSNFFEDKLFSVQKITSVPINLGYFSYAMYMDEA